MRSLGLAVLALGTLASQAGASPLIPLIITGADAGGAPLVKVFAGETGSVLGSFLADAPAVTGGVRVGAADVNGDGFADVITGAGEGTGSQVKVFDGLTGTEIRSFLAYDPAFSGGVFVAGGDIVGDGIDDLMTGAGPGLASQVKVFDGQTGLVLRSFTAFDPGFLGGVRVGAADVTGDGIADIITGAGAGGGPHVKVFDGVTGAEIRSFFAFDPAFGGGVFVAGGDVGGDGIDDLLIGAGAGGSPEVKVFDGQTGLVLRSFLAFDPAFLGGVRVASVDVNHDGIADIVTGRGPGATPQVKVFDGATGAEIGSFLAYDPSFAGGVFVSAATAPVAVPEPSSMMMWAIAAVVTAASRRARRRRGEQHEC